MRNDRSLFGTIAGLGFLILFPGFVVYHYAVSSALIPPVLGGLFGGASLLFALVGLVHVAGRMQSRAPDVSTLERLVAFFGIYLFVWTAVAGIVIGNRAYAGPAIRESLGTLSIWLAAFFVGSRLRLDSKGARFGLALAAVAIVGVFLVSMIDHQSLLGPFLAFQGQGEGDVDEGATAYQGIGRSVLVTAITIAAVQDKFWKQASVLFLCAAALVSLGSRSHLFAALFIIVGLLVSFGFKKKQSLSTLVLLTMLIATSYAAMDVFLGTRAGEIANLDESTSWQARLVAQSRALEVIRANPFWGDFGYHYRASESAGYAHNILSAWASFGGVAFFIYAGLMLFALGMSTKRVLLRQQCSALWLVSFQVNLTALILAVASEPIFSSVFPALGWGFAVNALRDERRQKRVVAQAVRTVLRDKNVQCVA